MTTSRFDMRQVAALDRMRASEVDAEEIPPGVVVVPGGTSSTPPGAVIPPGSRNARVHDA